MSVNITLNVLRNITTKDIIQASTLNLTASAGEEVVQVVVPDVDVMMFARKYRFNVSTGDLEINGSYFYYLELTENAALHNSSNGNPQLAVGGQDTLNMILRKKDLDGAYHLTVNDNDRIYFNVSGAIDFPDYVDLVNGELSGDVYSALVLGRVLVNWYSDDIKEGNFTIEVVV